MKKYKDVISENFHYLVVKFSVYLNRHIFVMEGFPKFKNLFSQLVHAEEIKDNSRYI